jgi:Domain of unknown function (DUF4476)
MRFVSSSALRPAGLLIALLMLAFTSRATDYVRARIYTRGGETMQLYIDGAAIGQIGSDFRLPSLASGYHWLEFRFPNRRLPNRVTGYRTQAWFAPGFESVYELDPFPPRQRMSLTRVSCTPMNGGSYQTQYQYQQPQYQYQEPAQTYIDPNAGVQCANMLAPQDINALLSSIRARDFESTKLSVAKQAVGSSSILAQDVGQILRTFEFESTRLEFAKFAYSRCCDQRNYFKVNDAFEFESSVTEMQRFTQAGR